MDKYHWLSEDLKSISNLCEVGCILIKCGHYHLLPTILENLYIDATRITEEHCIVDDKGV